jgi:filamentous hemagglutinin family protein
MPFRRDRLPPNHVVSLASFVAAAFALAPSYGQNILPTNGVVTSGAASIRQSGADLSVTQNSSRAIVNWGSFSIGPSNGVTFDQPNASSAILNRVTGSTTSTIAGQLQGNGQVYLVNPNGIAITKTGAVQVGGGFVASTLGIADNDFNKGTLNFGGKGASAGVSNAGSIAAAPGGFVGLLGGTVANSGVVSVPLGKVAMGSGEQATLNLTGDNFLQVAVPTNTRTADGQALIDVSGKVRAAGGSVQLRAATVAQAIRNAVNVPGELSVTSARARGGSIILGGGDGGDVSVTGRLKASGRTAAGTIAIGGHDVALRQAKLAAASAKGHGGTVTVTGTNAVSLVSSLVDASGATAGGAIRIGGDLHGASDLTSAQTTTIDSASTLNASASASGDGGTVAVWSTGTTSVHGAISAQGGPRGGDGGQIETSGESVDFAGLSVNASSPHGKAGTWLVDPDDLTVDGAAATTIQNSLNGGTGVTLQTTSATASGPGNISSGAGDINVDAAISWSTSALLTLSAFHSIVVNAPITISGSGGLNLTTNNNVGGTSSGDGALTFTMGQGSVQFTTPAAEPGLVINGDVYHLVSDMTGVESMDDSAGNFALAHPIDASASGTFGSSPVATFGGNFEGLGNTIAGLKINDASGAAPTGLFGLLEGAGTIRNLGLVGGAIVAGAGGEPVGGLVGENDGNVVNSYATASVTSASGDVGGLVGDNFGSIQTSYATGAVSSLGGGSAGGLVGSNNGDCDGCTGSVANSYATGSVTSTSGDAGGLVGDNNFGTVSNSHATGAVSGSGSEADIGGLIGYNIGVVQISYATGAVSSSGGAASVGGLVGFNDSDGDIANGGGVVQTSYATGAVLGTGAGTDAGGLVGVNFNTVQTSYATGAVSATGAGAATGGLVGDNPGGNIQASYATGAVSGAGALGGLVGVNSEGLVSSSYWDTQTTGQATSAGGTGLTTAQLQGALPAGFAAPWATGPGLYPFLTNFFPNGVQAVSGFAYKDAGATPLASGANGANIVTVGANGAAFGAATSGANGYYYVFGPAGSLPSGTNIVAYTQANATTGAANAATYTVSTDVANTSAVEISAGWQVDMTGSAGSLSALNAADAAAAGSLAPSAFALPNRQIDFGTSNFTLDTNLNLSGTLALEGAGSVTQPSGAITTGSLLLAGGSFALGSPNNSIGTLAAAVANLNLTVGPTLTVGTAADSSNVVITGATSFGTTSLTSTSGGITLATSINTSEESGPVSLTAAGDIVQQSGAPIYATNLAMNSTGGGIVLDALVDPPGPVSLAAFGDIVEGAGAPGITATSLSAISTTGRVVLTSANNVGSVSGSAPLGFSIADAGLLSVGGITSTSGPVALGSLNGIIQTGPIIGQSLYAGTVSGDIILTNTANSVAAIAGTAGVTDEFLSSIASSIGRPLAPGIAAGPGTFQFYDSVPDLTIGAVNFYASVVNNAPVLGSASRIQATATDGAGSSIVVSNAGNLVVDSTVRSLSPVGIIQLAATGGFTNNVGPSAIATSGGIWQVYSNSPSGDVFGDLNSDASAVWDTRFGQPVTAAGDRYVFAFQPTITITSANLIKFDGQDVSPLVAANYTISGLEPGVPGAFLGDPAAAVYSGTPLVTSLGSPASAPLSGSPYPITVAPGTFTVSEGYALVLDSAGKLTVAPIPTANPGAPTDPGFLPGLTQINNPAQTDYDVGGYEQVLPRFTVDCNEPPSLPDPNRYSDPDQALRAISQSLENYFKHCQNPTQTTIANALDEYAAKLQVLAPRLPAALRNVPAIVAESARRVRAARSRSEAVAVLRQTVAAIHKEIALVLSEDPETRSREVRDGDVIAGALGGANVALVNSGGL